MHFFCVYTHESGRVEFARDGFFLWAFVFTFFLTVYKRLWLLSFIVFAASCVSYTAFDTHFVNLPCYLLLELTIKLYVGFSYSDWLCRKLKKKKYSMAATVLAHDTLHAKLRFMGYIDQESKNDAASRMQGDQNR
ncbi:MAG: Erum7620/ECH_0207 family putative T1SS effector [Anaplasma sp.]